MPLHIASIFGCSEIIPVLLAAGANVNAIYLRPSDDEQEYEPETPIESAIAFCHLHPGGSVIRGSSLVFALLLRAGADLPIEDERGEEPYLQRVADAGGWEAYRRAHVDKLALLFTPKPETGKGRRRSKRRRSPRHGLPPELVRRVVEYWAHAGYPVSSCDQYSRATN